MICYIADPKTVLPAYVFATATLVHLLRRFSVLLPIDLLSPYRLLPDNPQEVPLIGILRPPPNTLTPIRLASRIAAHVKAPTIILLHLLFRQWRRLRFIPKLILNERLTNRLSSCQKCVFTGDTEVKSGFTMSDIALLCALIDCREEISDIANIDVRPDVCT